VGTSGEQSSPATTDGVRRKGFGIGFEIAVISISALMLIVVGVWAAFNIRVAGGDASPAHDTPGVATPGRVSAPMPEERAPTLPMAERPLAYAMHPDGSGLHKLKDSEVSWTWVSDFLPNGDGILTMGEHRGVYSISIKTGSTSLLQETQNNLRGVTISSKGQAAAISDDGNLWTTYFGSTRLPERLTTDGLSRDPQWSRDGEQIAFTSTRSGKSQVYVVDRDGSNLRQLTTNTTSNSFGPIWESNKRILFGSAYTHNWEIYSVDLDTLEVSQLTNSPQQEANFSLSPDKTRIAYTNLVGKHWHIFVMDADGTNARQLTDGQRNEGQPRWSPNGKWITFYEDVGYVGP
jgi:Tol biopolymer transport system component